MERVIEFESEGAILRGKLFTPEGAGPHPALVMAHGTSATIPMVMEQYALELHAAGFMVLAYDHRNFGISDGEPRQEINPWKQARGYRDAVSFMLSLPDVIPERVAIWGDSFAGMEALVVAALDPRITAVIAHVPSCGAELPQMEPTAENFKQLRDTFDHGNISATRETTTGPLPVVSPDQLGTPSLVEPIQAFRWFMEYGGRPGSGWQNRVTRVIPNTPVPFSPYLAAPFLKADLLMLVAPDDEMARANPKVSRATFDLVTGVKRWVEIDGGHFGALYHPGERFDRAVAAQREFLVERLVHAK
jgi:pimeloyl-ACP methyl ester carboxylesterase